MFRRIIIFVLLESCASMYPDRKNQSCSVCCGDPSTRHRLPEVCRTHFPPEVTAPQQITPAPFELNVVNTSRFADFDVSITATNGTLMTEWIIFAQDVEGEDTRKGRFYTQFPGYWGTRQTKRAHRCCDALINMPTMIYEFDRFKHDVGVSRSNTYTYLCDCGYVKYPNSRSFVISAIVFRNRSEYWIIHKQIKTYRPKKVYRD